MLSNWRDARRTSGLGVAPSTLKRLRPTSAIAGVLAIVFDNQDRYLFGAGAIDHRVWEHAHCEATATLRAR